ncbi:hypothetical protein ABZ027_04965 [Streptomyces sp. NPDC006332]|uniref:hypothetical protein n=1 Tax=Streptomyces sp. NPDC006332 TaxID=3155456 RepID=UPI0033AEE279
MRETRGFPLRWARPVTTLGEDGEVFTSHVAPMLGPSSSVTRRPAAWRQFADGEDGVISVERHGAAQNDAVAA